MLVSVHFDDGVETFFEGVAICSEADYREDDGSGWVIANLKNFGFVAGVDAVT